MTSPAAELPEVTILIPHFQTLDAVRLCLRSIRRFTHLPCRVRVLDNGSRDSSIDYLRSVKWIECVNTGIANDVLTAHPTSLNKAVASVETPYFLIMHSDTYVHRDGWLSFLLDQSRAGSYAAVGSRHQTIRVSRSRRVAHFIARHPGVINRYFGREWKPGVPWIRSCLALYRTDLFVQAGCRFHSAGGEDATHRASERLVKCGHRILALPACVFGYYVFHKGDTTKVVNAPLARDDATIASRRERHVRHLVRFRGRPGTQSLLADATLDE